MSNPKNILLIVTGSIACYKACELVSLIKKQGHHVKVVLTESAQKFVGKTSFEALSGKPVLTDQFEDPLAHIDLTRWADFAIIAPATGNTINKLSCGVAEDLVGSLFLAWPKTKPLFIAPAMNTMMLEHPATIASFEKIRTWGHHILPTQYDRLACGEIGYGKMLEPSNIWESITKIIFPINPLNIVITSGGTREPIDGVRYIGNSSSGKTGKAITEFLLSHGHHVTLLHSNHSVIPSDHPNLRKQGFSSTQELMELTKSSLTTYRDGFIQCAAVSDYGSAQIGGCDQSFNFNLKDRKISSNNDEILLSLKKNPKIINHIKSWSKNPEVFLVGFKLTKTDDKTQKDAAIKNLFSASDCDLVVHNDFNEIQKLGKHVYHLIKKGDESSSLDLDINSLCAEIRVAIESCRTPTKEPSEASPPKEFSKMSFNLKSKENRNDLMS